MHKQQDRSQRAALQHATSRTVQHAMLHHGTSFCNMQRCSNLQHATRTTDRMQRTTCNGQRCNGRHCNMQRETALQRTACNLHSRYDARDRIATCNVNMQRTAVVRWYRAREPPARARVRHAVVRNGEGHFSAILNGSAAQCRGI